MDGDGAKTATVDIGSYEYEPFSGDWDGDGLVEAADIDELFANLGDPAYDLDGDGDADSDDVDYLIHEVLGTEYGDANLDGLVEGADYTLWADNYLQPGGWAEGDLTGDGFVEGADYTIWADNYGFGTKATKAGASPAGAGATATPSAGAAGEQVDLLTEGAAEVQPPSAGQAAARRSFHVRRRSRAAGTLLGHLPGLAELGLIEQSLGSDLVSL